MKFIFSTLKKTLFWSYDRGSWQYDVMCVLILAFIFFTPNRWFLSQRSEAAMSPGPRPLLVSSDEVGILPAGGREQVIAAHLRQKYGLQVDIARVDSLTDDSGKVTYRITEK
jgi:hypothetical protein